MKGERTELHELLMPGTAELLTPAVPSALTVFAEGSPDVSVPDSR
jgi:hypothetical protein